MVFLQGLSMSNENIGYWFTANDYLPNGDGRKIIVGESLSITGKLILCQNGLHYSPHPFDALNYAGGLILYKVEAIGEILSDHDKACTTMMLMLMLGKNIERNFYIWLQPCF